VTPLPSVVCRLASGVNRPIQIGRRVDIMEYILRLGLVLYVLVSMHCTRRVEDTMRLIVGPKRWGRSVRGNRSIADTREGVILLLCGDKRRGALWHGARKDDAVLIGSRELAEIVISVELTVFISALCTVSGIQRIDKFGGGVEWTNELSPRIR